MIINIRNAPQGWEQDPRFVYIGRGPKGAIPENPSQPGYFGNPFKLQKGESRGATLERFREWAIQRMRYDYEYEQQIKALSGKTLVCFCSPRPCHGDVLEGLSLALNPCKRLPEPAKAAPCETSNDGMGTSGSRGLDDGAGLATNPESATHFELWNEPSTEFGKGRSGVTDGQGGEG